MGDRQWALGVAMCIAAVGAPGCSLILDFSELADAGADASARCLLSEPNDVIADAVTIPAGVTNAALCGPDIDFYTIVLGDLDDVELVTTGAGVNLELQLLASGAVIDSSDGPGADEMIVRTEAMGNRLGAGTFLVRVAASSSAAGDEGDYSLTVTITTAIAPDAGPDA